MMTDVEIHISRRKRVLAALDETQRALNKEMAYSESVKDHTLIAFYKSHIKKLITMLDPTHCNPA